MRWLILTIAFLVSAANAAEPLMLKQLNLGDSEQAVHAAYPGIKCHTITGMVYRRCDVFLDDDNPRGLADLLDVGGQLSDVATLVYFDDKLSTVEFYIDSDGFDHIVALLREKYGAPTSRLDVPVQNRMGAQFTNEIVRWQRGGRIIEVERYHRRLDHMLLTLKTVDHDAQMAGRQREETKRAAAKL